MWRLLKAEITYSRTFLIIAYSMVFPSLIFLFIMEGGVYKSTEMRTRTLVVFHQMIFMAILFPIILGLTLDRRKSKRTRLHAQLIQPIGILGIIYLTLPVLFWFSIVIFFWIVNLFIQPGNIDSTLIWQTLSLTGLIFFLSSGPLFYDLNYCLEEKIQRGILNILAPLIFVVLVFLYYAAILPGGKYLDPVNTLMSHIGSSPFGAVMILLTGLAFAALGIVIVGHRRSYVE